MNLAYSVAEVVFLSTLNVMKATGMADYLAVSFIGPLKGQPCRAPEPRGFVLDTLSGLQLFSLAAYIFLLYSGITLLLTFGRRLLGSSWKDHVVIYCRVMFLFGNLLALYILGPAHSASVFFSAGKPNFGYGLLALRAVTVAKVSSTRQAVVGLLEWLLVCSSIVLFEGDFVTWRICHKCLLAFLWTYAIPTAVVYASSVCLRKNELWENWLPAYGKSGRDQAEHGASVQKPVEQAFCTPTSLADSRVCAAENPKRRRPLLYQSRTVMDVISVKVQEHPGIEFEEAAAAVMQAAASAILAISKRSAAALSSGGAFCVEGCVLLVQVVAQLPSKISECRASPANIHATDMGAEGVTVRRCVIPELSSEQLKAGGPIRNCVTNLLQEAGRQGNGRSGKPVPPSSADFPTTMRFYTQPAVMVADGGEVCKVVVVADKATGVLTTARVVVAQSTKIIADVEAAVRDDGSCHFDLPSCDQPGALNVHVMAPGNSRLSENGVLATLPVLVLPKPAANELYALWADMLYEFRQNGQQSCAAVDVYNSFMLPFVTDFGFFFDRVQRVVEAGGSLASGAASDLKLASTVAETLMNFCKDNGMAACENVLQKQLERASSAPSTSREIGPEHPSAGTKAAVISTEQAEAAPAAVLEDDHDARYGYERECSDGILLFDRRCWTVMSAIWYTLLVRSLLTVTPQYWDKLISSIVWTAISTSPFIVLTVNRRFYARNRASILIASEAGWSVMMLLVYFNVLQIPDAWRLFASRWYLVYVTRAILQPILFQLPTRKQSLVVCTRVVPCFLLWIKVYNSVPMGCFICAFNSVTSIVLAYAFEIARNRHKLLSQRKKLE